MKTFFEIKEDDIKDTLEDTTELYDNHTEDIQEIDLIYLIIYSLIYYN